MTKRSKGSRMGTSKKLTREVRQSGKLKLRDYLQRFQVGDAIQIRVNSSYHKGMPYKRFFGKHGKVVEKRGEAYLISLKDGAKEKKVICAAVHICKM